MAADFAAAAFVREVEPEPRRSFRPRRLGVSAEGTPIFPTGAVAALTIDWPQEMLDKLRPDGNCGRLRLCCVEDEDLLDTTV